jgi:hypothetical protein
MLMAECLKLRASFFALFWESFQSNAKTGMAHKVTWALFNLLTKANASKRQMGFAQFNSKLRNDGIGPGKIA